MSGSTCTVTPGGQVTLAPWVEARDLLHIHCAQDTPREKGNPELNWLQLNVVSWARTRLSGGWDNEQWPTVFHKWWVLQALGRPCVMDRASVWDDEKCCIAWGDSGQSTGPAGTWAPPQHPVK